MSLVDPRRCSSAAQDDARCRSEDSTTFWKSLTKTVPEKNVRKFWNKKNTNALNHNPPASKGCREVAYFTEIKIVEWKWMVCLRLQIFLIH